MKFHTSSHTKQAGDTIVEVIIAVAIISTILAGAFLVTTNSSRGIRDSEEHAQALQYLQGQVELLRAASSRSGGLPTTLTTPFCLDATTYYQPATGNSHCTLGNLYKLAITSPTAAAAVNATTTFNLSATWPSLVGGNDTVYLAYKVPVTP